MGRGGSGGGGHMSSGGGHSVSHSGGGHHVSSPGGGFGRSSSHSFASPPRRQAPPPLSQPQRRQAPPPPRGPMTLPPRGPVPPRGPIMPPPPRQVPPPPPPRYVRNYTYSTYREPVHEEDRRSYVRTVITVTVIIMLLAVLFATIVPLLGHREQKTTIVRSKLTDVPAYNNNCVIDETGEFDSPSYVATKLKDFYDLTGVQPYIIWKAYDSSLKSDADKEEWALTYYDENIDAENTFLYVYFENQYDQGDGYMYYVNGTKSVSIMDAEAVEIFWNYIDRYWWDDISTDSLFIRVFNETGEVIMREPTNGWDFGIKVAVILGVLLIISAIGVVIYVKAKSKHQEAVDTERILKTPVEKVSTDTYSSEVQEALDKYGVNK